MRLAQRDPVRLTIGAEQADGHDVANLELRWREQLRAMTAPKVVAAVNVVALRKREIPARRGLGRILAPRKSIG